jgi:hypothetical protein
MSEEPEITATSNGRPVLVVMRDDGTFSIEADHLLPPEHGRTGYPPIDSIRHLMEGRPLFRPKFRPLTRPPKPTE